MEKNNTDKIKLEPCPFCGGNAVIKKDEYSDWVMCEKCGCHSLVRDTTSQAIEVWNNRVTNHPTSLKFLTIILFITLIINIVSLCFIFVSRKIPQCILEPTITTEEEKIETMIQETLLEYNLDVTEPRYNVIDCEKYEVPGWKLEYSGDFFREYQNEEFQISVYFSTYTVHPEREESMLLMLDNGYPVFKTPDNHMPEYTIVIPEGYISIYPRADIYINEDPSKELFFEIALAFEEQSNI